MKPYLVIAQISLIAVLTATGPAQAADTSAQKTPINVCIVSGEHLQPGDIVTYVHKEEGKPDRTLRFCCRKCLARFKANPEPYLKKLDRLESGKPEADKDQTSP